MERCLLEQISRLREHFSLRVVSATMEPRIQGVEHIRVRLPVRPFLAKFGLYYWLAPFMARISHQDMVVSVGALSGRRPDVVLLHYLHSSYSGPRGSSTSNSRLRPRQLYAAVLHRLFVALERRQYGSGSPCVVAVSSGLAEEVRSQYPAADVRVVPNGLDDTYFQPSAEQGDVLRKQVGVPGGEFVAAFVGGDWRRKGLHLCIRALGRLHGGKGGTVHLVVAGQGDTDVFQRLAQAEGVEHLVHFAGQVDTSAGIYALADVLLLPSGYETFSMVAHEAAASGVPVIGTEVHGVREIIQAGGGILVNCDADDIAGALEQLVRDPHHVAKLGAAARAYARDFTWERSAKGLAEVLTSVTSRVRSVNE
jgi:glycosyltransferase involved in cell wall biosynthesis